MKKEEKKEKNAGVTAYCEKIGFRHHENPYGFER